jgi:spermidine/putrescine-binding protein
MKTRREFLKKASELGIVVVGSTALPRHLWASEDLASKETTTFKVPYQMPSGKDHLRGTNLGYLSWEPWCRPYQMDIFSAHTGIKPIDTALFGSSDEMITKLGAGADETYDVFSPEAGSVKACVDKGWFQPINRDNIPHYKDLHPGFQDRSDVVIDGKDYSIPFVWGTDAVIHNTDKIPEIDSWSFLSDPKYEGRCSIWDAAFPAIATIAISMGLKKPFDLGEDELQQVKAEFVKIKPQLRTFHTSMSQAISLMASGEIWAIADAWVAMMEPLREQGVNVKWSFPKEGVYGWHEGICISSQSKNKEGAELFADWCIGEEFGAILAKDIGYYPCSTACTVNLTQEEISSVYLDRPELAANTTMMSIPPNMDRYQEIWAEIKAM